MNSKERMAMSFGGKFIAVLIALYFWALVSDILFNQDRVSGTLAWGVLIALCYFGWRKFRNIGLEKYNHHETNLRLPSYSDDRNAPMPTSAYKTRSSIMNQSERAFFYELQKQLPQDYYIFPNMRIADIINAVDGAGFYKRRNEILPKHIDFLVCDSSFRPLVAIEVNGKSHLRADRIERDNLIREIFAEAELPLEFVNVGTSFAESISNIRSHLDI